MLMQASFPFAALAQPFFMTSVKIFQLSALRQSTVGIHAVYSSTLVCVCMPFLSIMPGLLFTNRWNERPASSPTANIDAAYKMFQSWSGYPSLYTFEFLAVFHWRRAQWVHAQKYMGVFVHGPLRSGLEWMRASKHWPEVQVISFSVWHIFYRYNDTCLKAHPTIASNNTATEMVERSPCSLSRSTLLGSPICSP